MNIIIMMAVGCSFVVPSCFSTIPEGFSLLGSFLEIPGSFRGAEKFSLASWLFQKFSQRTEVFWTWERSIRQAGSASKLPSML